MLAFRRGLRLFEVEENTRDIADLSVHNFSPYKYFWSVWKKKNKFHSSHYTLDFPLFMAVPLED